MLPCRLMGKSSGTRIEADAFFTQPGTAAGPRLGSILSALILATLIGALVRAVHVLIADFPLNDGALFLVMTQDLMENGFALPVTTTYNGGDIPFLYPPLGFYLAGAASLTGLDLFTVFRLLPLIISTLTIPAVYLLTSTTLPTHFAALLATMAYALIPRSIEWTIAGGGLTRGLGLLFAILVLWAALRLERRPDPGRCVTLGALAALATLSHPEAVIVAGTWLLAVLATTAHRRALLGWFLGAAGVALVALLPWLVTILSTHGLSAIVGAGQAGLELGAGLQSLLTFQMTREPWITPIAVLALIGVLLRARGRDWRWLLWVAVVIVDPWGGTTYVAPILGAAAAIALVEAILPAFHWTRPRASVVWPNRTIGSAPYVVLGLLLTVGVAGSIGARTNQLSPLFGLPAATRTAMTEVANATAPDARIIVVSGTAWWVDAVAEWFPVLSQRTSLSTAQGSEWLGANGWRRAVTAHQTLQACAFDSITCFEQWRVTNASTADYVFLPKGSPNASPLEGECCPALRAPLIAASYPVVFDLSGGTLLAVP